LAGITEWRGIHRLAQRRAQRMDLKMEWKLFIFNDMRLMQARWVTRFAVTKEREKLSFSAHSAFSAREITGLSGIF